MSIEKVDVIVIGSGWFGLAAAKTYLQVQPNINLVILESSPTLGGTWVKSRLYPGLRTNNMLGTLEYTDFPMDTETFGVKPGEHIPGEVVLEYLEKYAAKFDLVRRMRFNSKVVQVERRTVAEEEWWEISTEDGRMFTCDKVMFATGLTSEALVPVIEGSEAFGAPIVHIKDLGANLPGLLDAKPTSVTVIGTYKSAYDCVYTFARAGIHVDWIIRKSGHGPGWMIPPYVTPFKKWLEKLVMTRLLTWFSPCIWGNADGYGWIRGLLHGTRGGRWFVDRFWDVLTADVVQLNGYDQHAEVAKLRPWSDPFWTAASISLLNYPTNFFDLVKDPSKVTIHIEDISHVSPKTIYFTSGSSISSSALICATGWRHVPTVKFLPEGIESKLGLPSRSKSNADDALTLAKADKEILARFPRLVDQPKALLKAKAMQDGKNVLDRPFGLYRFIAPPTDAFGRSITFQGVAININTSMNAELQALWAVGYLSGKMRLDKKTPEDRARSGVSFDEERMWETVITNRFGKWRYPGGFGARYPDFVFDSLPYFDTLLRDLEVPHRRKGSVLADVFTPYSPKDYEGIVDEWMAVTANKERIY